MTMAANMGLGLVKIANREDTDQTALFRSSLIWVCTVCLDIFYSQLTFKILEHLQQLILMYEHLREKN